MTTSSHPPIPPTHQAPSEELETKETTRQKLNSQKLSTKERTLLQSLSAEVLAQTLAEKLAISNHDWHKLSANRNVRAKEQAAAALVYMLKDNPEEALPRLTQAVGWLDKTLKAPPCPTHGKRKRTAEPAPATDLG
ncbi:DUF6439 family protein [Synechococcus sp. PCC 7335]|uniref:DUF6439 family protein n=1 Tax=Synechococcus sp. (strain ATCC 29403 / PCC 7335) TaxID=91464 RepID=UPI0026C35197